MAADKPPFLQNNPATQSGVPVGSGNPPFDNRPQKQGRSAEGGLNGSEHFPNRTQPTRKEDANPQSIPSGGTLPFPGASKPTQTPFKLGK